MMDLDDKIRRALEGSGVEPADGDQEETLRAQVLETFRGKQRWMTVAVWIEQFVFFGLTVFVAVRFFQAESTRDQIFYATLFLACFWVGTMIKLWYWMLLNKNSVIREVKRLELQVALLDRRLRDDLRSPGSDPEAEIPRAWDPTSAA